MFELTEEQIEKTFNDMREHAEMVLHKDGEINGMIDAYDKDGKNMMVPLMYRDNHEKQHLWMALKHVFKKLDIVCFFMLTEAWMVKGSKENEDLKDEILAAAQKQLLHEHPEREEVVVMQYVAHKGARTEMYPMIRTKKGKFKKLGEVLRQDDDVGTEGMVPDMLPPMPTDDSEILDSEYIN
jgi:hypothetical protein